MIPQLWRVAVAWAGRQLGLGTPYYSELLTMGRTSFVYRPVGSQLAGAVLVLHGSQAVASDMFGLGFEALAEARGFVVVYPEMRTLRADQWGYRDDIPYFSALATRLQEADFGVPKDKIFICGHSAGGTMVTFLQNEMNEFEAAGVVEAAVGNLQDWDMGRRGKRTMVVWNHGDPVLSQYAPGGLEMAYYNLTVETLRRGAGTVPDRRDPLPKLLPVVEAELRIFETVAEAPELQIVSWTSQPGRHDWALPSWTHSVDATRLLVDFFFTGPAVALVV